MVRPCGRRAWLYIFVTARVSSRNLTATHSSAITMALACNDSSLRSIDSAPSITKLYIQLFRLSRAPECIATGRVCEAILRVRMTSDLYCAHRLKNQPTAVDHQPPRSREENRYDAVTCTPRLLSVVVGCSGFRARRWRE